MQNYQVNLNPIMLVSHMMTCRGTWNTKGIISPGTRISTWYRMKMFASLITTQCCIQVTGLHLYTKKHAM